MASQVIFNENIHRFSRSLYMNCLTRLEVPFITNLEISGYHITSVAIFKENIHMVYIKTLAGLSV